MLLNKDFQCGLQDRPEHRFPFALNDCLLAYNALLEKYKSEQIMVAGISAGGNLLLSMLLALKEKAIPMPCAAVDLLFEGELVKFNESNDWILPERFANLRNQ